MAEVFDFGLQKHKIKMDGKFFENNLFAVAGDTGRRLEVQLLNSDNTVQNTTGISLRLNADVAGKATYAEAVLVDATNGLYELDLPNGMLIAPGNWQFQWQITDANDKKLHSFAFMGSIGSNLSEGGSEATNFYLNADELKQMQDDLINGTFDSAILETNITEKLTNLETQYAPKLTEVTAQLVEKADKSQLPQVLKYLYMNNEVDSQMSMIDLKNFGRTNKKIPFVIHNYTDARLMQLDNVGSNTNLQLTNAHNPTNRPDKDGNYVGTGVFIDLQEYQLATNTNESVLKLTNTGGFEWSGLKGGTVFTNGKEVSTDYLYEFRSKKAHANLFRFGNAGQYVLSFINDMPVNSIPTRTAIESSAGQTNGMLIQTRAGSLNLKSFNGKTINTGSLDVTDKLVVTNDISVGKNLQIGRTTDADAINNSIYLDEGSTLKYKNSAGVIKLISFAS